MAKKTTIAGRRRHTEEDGYNDSDDDIYDSRSLRSPVTENPYKPNLKRTSCVSLFISGQRVPSSYSALGESSPSRLLDELAGGYPYVSFDQLLQISDIISLHVPLSAATTHLIGAAEISKVMPGVVIINTARGAVIDEGDMAVALENGHIAAVGLDVYKKEPLIDERLVKNERALRVPHLGTHTKDPSQGGVHGYGKRYPGSLRQRIVDHSPGATWPRFIDSELSSL
ncbi:D-isomer specific 2-hydroxyacid dehydrogenase [Ilyonectria robusta]|uniref:D-isomer specific 2-hydroxyacid dehydrogenase n=1 Tax=Ilyonectria robusta TaxID=1079257 RepID=UPI001E8E8A80|nr:D-isomer specific 2-hydroxyacid dehydrogenase [Ilyonectria robusta]KAH8714628.1 D-isomer specific 2-hydroxyacid dehydrogenase [Ilyonectria robusta]